MRFGIYIHFPWCRNRCPYCDFAIALAPQGPPHEAYLAAILAELDYRAAQFEGKELVSIYLGGGTPSIWKPSCVAELVHALRRRFDAETASLEVSLEANPIDCTEEAFPLWKAAGVNRLLIGVQATNQADLLTLGRDHSMGDGLSALRRTLHGGFHSVGADIILGVPGGSAGASSIASLLDVAALKPAHISAYELTIEERTLFGKRAQRGELIPEDDDTLAALYERAHDELTLFGYEHYEVSSYALPGHRAVHNSLYWQGADYLGLGNGAASLEVLPDGGARRWQNRRSARGYLTDQAAQHVDFKDEIEPEAFATEKLWLAMRTRNGVSEDALAHRPEVVAELLEAGLVERHGGRITPSLRGFLYNNQLIRRLGID